MMLTLGLLSVLVGSAAAQDAPPGDPAPGDRIEITFASGGTVIGILVAPARHAPPASWTLDLASEFPGLVGTLTVPKHDIQKIRKLRIVQQPRVCDLGLNFRTPDPVQRKPATAAVAPDPAPSQPPADDAARKTDEEMRKAREMYARFPSPDWSPERYNMIRVKQYRGQLPTPMEREFAQAFDLWVKGRDAANQK